MGLREKLEEYRQQQEQETATIEQVKDTWIGSINELYQQIDQWLAEIIGHKVEGIVYIDTEFEEERLGRYLAKTMSFPLGPKRVKLEPVARLILGAQGRVNFFTEGRRSEGCMLLRIENEADHTQCSWEIRWLRDKSRKEQLDKTSFERLLEDWLTS